MEKHISLKFLEKNEFDFFANILFKILNDNMSTLVGSDFEFKDNFNLWHHAYGGAFKNREERKIVLILLDDEEIIGFFGYCPDKEFFHIEEIQILPDYRGKYGIFRKLYAFVLENLPKGLKYTDAFVHKQNEKSLAVHQKLGLKICGENRNGKLYHLCGSFDALVLWFEGKNNKNN